MIVIEPTQSDEGRSDPYPLGTPSVAAPTPEAASTYGPMRRCVTGKDGPQAYWRPAALSQDDFVSIMREVVPQLIDDVTQGQKRDHSEVEVSEDSSGAPASSRPRTTEVLSVQEVDELWDIMDQAGHEAFVAEYMAKRATKEFSHSFSRNAEEGRCW